MAWFRSLVFDDDHAFVMPSVKAREQQENPIGPIDERQRCTLFWLGIGGKPVSMVAAELLLSSKPTTQARELISSPSFHSPFILLETGTVALGNRPIDSSPASRFYIGIRLGTITRLLQSLDHRHPAFCAPQISHRIRLS